RAWGWPPPNRSVRTNRRASAQSASSLARSDHAAAGVVTVISRPPVLERCGRSLRSTAARGGCAGGECGCAGRGIGSGSEGGDESGDGATGREPPPAHADGFQLHHSGVGPPGPFGDPPEPSGRIDGAAAPVGREQPTRGRKG